MATDTSDSRLDNRINYRLEDDDLQWLLSRTERMHQPSQHVAGRVELLMWRMVLRGELGRIRLTTAQARCLADVYAGSALDAAVGTPLGLVYAEAYDAFRLARRHGGEVSSYGRKHGIDEQALLDLLADLGPAADAALRDALNRWWQDSDTHTGDADSFRRVGIAIIDDEG